MNGGRFYWPTIIGLGSLSKGNECRRLLERTDILDEMLPSEHYKFLVAFGAFNLVVASTFSYDLDPDYERYILQFEQAWLDCGLSVTPKVHLIFEYYAEFSVSGSQAPRLGSTQLP